MPNAIEHETRAVLNLLGRDPSSMQMYLETRLEAAVGPSWLDDKRIWQVCRTAEMLGGLMRYGPYQKAFDMSEDKRDAAGRSSWQVMEKDPDSIRNVLAQA